TTTSLLKKVCAAIYLSMDKLWEALSDIALIATFLIQDLNILIRQYQLNETKHKI
ncbi:10242_t:CDS:1, partial [Racocetra persica]